LRTRFIASFAFFLIIVGSQLSCVCPTVSIIDPIQEPSEGEIIGTWASDRCRSIDSRLEVNPVTWTCKWIFKSDGTFQMVDVPEWFMSGIGNWASNGNSATGSWEISNRDSHWIIVLYFDVVNDQARNERRDLIIYGKESPFSIPIFLGDADAGYVILFERIE